jgi:hypothetical protein
MNSELEHLIKTNDHLSNMLQSNWTELCKMGKSKAFTKALEHEQTHLAQMSYINFITMIDNKDYLETFPDRDPKNIFPSTLDGFSLGDLVEVIDDDEKTFGNKGYIKQLHYFGFAEVSDEGKYSTTRYGLKQIIKVR